MTGATNFSVLKRLAAKAVFLPPLLSLAANYFYPVFLIDDAYITFRYAENLARGWGLFMNQGEAVLGTSTPLFAILLALGKLAGLSTPAAAIALGMISTAALVLLIQIMAGRELPLLAAMGLGLVLALHPLLPFTANSGMETGLSMLAVFGAIFLALRSRYGLAGAVAGAAFLLRPDGALAALIVIAIALVHAPKKVWRPLLTAGLVVMPWLIYAIITYGSWVPHSVPAKQLIHPASPLKVLVAALAALNLGSIWFPVLFAFAPLGIFVSLRRRSELAWFAAWMLLYLVGLAASRIDLNYVWYITPLVPGIVLFAGLGIFTSIRFLLTKLRAEATAPMTTAVIALVVLLIMAGGLSFKILPVRNALSLLGYGRADVYLQIGQWLRPQCRPGDVVFVGELGALSWELRDQYIVDSAGLISPEVFNFRKEDRDRLIQSGELNPPGDGSAAWVRQTIARYQPRYIVTYRLWLHSAELLADPEFMRSYHRLVYDGPAYQDYVILERTP